MAQEFDTFFPVLNYVLRERADPLISWVLSLFAPEPLGFGYILLQCIVIAIGTSLSLGYRKSAGNIFNTLALLSFLVWLSGFSPTGLRWHWFPLMYWAFDRSFSLKTFASLVPASFFLCCWLFVSGSLGPWGVFWLLGMLAIKHRHTGEVLASLPALSLLYLVSGAAFLVSTVCIPYYLMPDYPPGALLAPISSLLQFGTTYWGPEVHPFPVHPEAYREAALQVSLRALAVLGICVLLGRIFLVKLDRALLTSFCFLLFCVFVEALMSSSLLPFAVISRVVPGLAVAAFPWVLLPVGIFPLAVLAFSEVQRVKLSSGLMVVGLAFIALEAKAPLSVTQGNVLSADMTDSERIKHSQSAFVIKTWGEWILDANLPQRKEGKLQRVPITACQISASHNAAAAGLAHDGDEKTRWGTAKPMAPNDWFEVVCPDSIPVQRLVLRISATPADFPRGIRLELAEDEQDYRQVLNFPDWYGPVRWTEAGYPYFGSQSDVVLDLPKNVSARRFRFTQLGSSESFDWSVGELEFYNAVP